MSGILGARKTKEGRRERGASGGDFGKKAFRADCDDGQGLRAMQDLNCTSQKVKKGEAAALINHFMIWKICLIHTLRFGVDLEESGKPFHNWPGLSACTLWPYH